MKTISKALVWYPDRRVVPAKISRCECGRLIVTRPADEPKVVESPEGEHLHVVLKREPVLNISSVESCRCAEFVGDEPSCPKHGVKEIPVIFRD